MRVGGDGEDEEDARRYAGTGAYTFVPACTHQQPPSRHPTPPAIAIYTSRALRTSSCNMMGTTSTYGPLSTTSLLRITSAHPPTPLTVMRVDLTTLHQCLFKTALGPIAKVPPR